MASSQSDIVARILKIADKTSGRDRLCRLVQYGSKFVSWLLEHGSLSPELIKKLRDLESFISTARKLFRLGKSVDNFRAALQTVHLRNPLLRLLITLTKLNRGLYLVIDHLIWAYRMKLVKVNIDTWNKHANRFWLLAICLGLLRDVYEFLRAVHIERKRLQQYSSGPDAKEMSVSMWSVLQNVAYNNPPVMVDLVKNSVDLFIPVSRLDILYIPSGIVGLLGVVSSLASIMTEFNEQLKLKFS